jgi:hypothetical protein
VAIDTNGGMKSEMKHRVTQGEKVIVALRKIFKGEGLPRNAKRNLHEGMVLSTLQYGREICTTSAEDRRRMGMIQIKWMRAMCGLSIMGRVRNEEVGRRCGSELIICVRIDRNVLRLYVHVERMEEEKMVKRVYWSRSEGSRGKGRPKLRWMDG